MTDTLAANAYEFETFDEMGVWGYETERVK
jgi:hypothetical protein